MDSDYAANVGRLNAATLASLAAAPGAPANVRILTRNLENSTTLTWSAPPGGLAAAYEVVMRGTDQPYWEQVSQVGNVTRATFNESKDNVIFGVRAVDHKGHRSLVVVPEPQR